MHLRVPCGWAGNLAHIWSALAACLFSLFKPLIFFFSKAKARGCALKGATVRLGGIRGQSGVMGAGMRRPESLRPRLPTDGIAFQPPVSFIA